MVKTEIQFTETDAPFQAAIRPNDDERVETSFSQSPQATGELRVFQPNNGHYESRHPIQTPNGDTIGFLANGLREIGYTFACLYTGGCFWIAHHTYVASVSGGGSAVSLVDETGRFMLKKGTKYGVIRTFGFGSNWIHDIEAFKKLDDGKHLFYLTKSGFALFDIFSREIAGQVEFASHPSHWSGFALSPKVLTLAIVLCERGQQDPIDGEDRYRSFLRLYDLKSGSVMGETALPGDKHMHWQVQFSENGRLLQVESKSASKVFEMSAG